MWSAERGFWNVSNILQAQRWIIESRYETEQEEDEEELYRIDALSEQTQKNMKENLLKNLQCFSAGQVLAGLKF